MNQTGSVDDLLMAYNQDTAISDFYVCGFGRAHFDQNRHKILLDMTLDQVVNSFVEVRNDIKQALVKALDKFYASDSNKYHSANGTFTTYNEQNSDGAYESFLGLYNNSRRNRPSDPVRFDIFVQPSEIGDYTYAYLFKYELFIPENTFKVYRSGSLDDLKATFVELNEKYVDEVNKRIVDGNVRGKKDLDFSEIYALMDRYCLEHLQGLTPIRKKTEHSYYLQNTELSFLISGYIPCMDSLKNEDLGFLGIDGSRYDAHLKGYTVRDMRNIYGDGKWTSYKEGDGIKNFLVKRAVATAKNLIKSDAGTVIGYAFPVEGFLASCVNAWLARNTLVDKTMKRSTADYLDCVSSWSALGLTGLAIYNGDYGMASTAASTYLMVKGASDTMQKPPIARPEFFDQDDLYQWGTIDPNLKLTKREEIIQTSKCNLITPSERNPISQVPKDSKITRRW